ncbi:urease accessory protein UreF [Hydrocarboniclastica marina]|uniref:Urease accessory protein UreF n=1 Tax=Hydrocarboniclastica marina TaxID=2259620 RepID=A0A4P7XJJ3_9ALTE|nr:urease accessory UreF family protein [Hydrocarboniclastica marina]QCF26724.1 urease accessory protein UreF [Hydrocarboniclastica marina]
MLVTAINQATAGVGEPGIQAAPGLTDLALLQLLRLVSPSLPIGGFAWSQGLEYAIDSGVLTGAEQIGNWLEGVMRNNLTHLDLPLILRLHQAAEDGERAKLEHWNDFILACRETHELYQEDIQLGAALYRLLASLDSPTLGSGFRPVSMLCGFAETGAGHNIPAETCALGWLWSWLENQLTVASKTLPLGQTDVQKLLQRLIPALPGCVAVAKGVADEDLGTSFPGFTMNSAWHETQYSRLFRS